MPMARAIHGQMCLGSSVPLRLPALLNGWHGYPAVKMSTGSTVDQSTVVKSPMFGAPGWWCCITLIGPGSMSDHHASEPPKTDWAAISRPPYPVHNEPIHKAPPLCWAIDG